jgi:peptidoglycan/LPS O-acetylase OafA/YrhL
LTWITLDFLAHATMLHGLYPLFDVGGGPATAGIALAGMAVKIIVSVAVAAIFFQLVERRFLNQPSRADVARDPVTALR